MNAFTVLAFVAFAFSAVAAYPARFKDCGNNEIISADVTPCDSHPCVFKKGTTVTLTVKYRANQSTTKGNLAVTVKVGDNEVPFPEIDNNACNYTPCPLEKGKEYEFKYPVVLQEWFPAMSTNMKWLVTGDNGVLACATADVELAD